VGPDGKAGEGGFSLLEMMAVVAILGVLTAIAVASYFVATARAQEVACRSNRRAIVRAVNAYAAEHDSARPASLDDLAASFSGANWRHCPADPDVSLVYDAASGGVSCPLHPEP
jgi:general secretion pathway protein G